MIDFANDVRGQSARFVSPIRFPQTVGNYIAGALARAYDIRGPNSTIANGIASGLDAVIEGCAILAAGQAELIYAGGVDRLTPQLVSGLSRHGSQSSGPPAEAMFSDGACLFVLEREDSARQRGAGVLGLASEPRAAPLDAESPRSARADARPGEIRSVAGWRAPGAICIEDWIGRCLGALGAAALAAAVGALHGLPVPVPGSSGEARAVASPATDAAVIAGADGRETRLVITRGETEGPHHGR
jgi:3-oxoacyl-[acyl-carrier-protein] synthase II